MRVLYPNHALRRQGSTLAVVAVLLVGLVGMMAFAIDVGRVAHARTGLQSAADAGALAGLSNLQATSGADQNYLAGRTEVNKFVGGSAGNFPGLVVADSDIQFGYFDTTAPLGTRFSTLTGKPANAVRVALRRDGIVNPRLALSFASLLGKSDSAIQAQATAWMPPARGVLANGPLIPYAAQIDYYNAVAGLPTRSSSSDGFVPVDASRVSDQWKIGAAGTAPQNVPDGVKEIVLFSGDRITPGNFGSVDLGSASNGTPELIRQLLNGPNASDYAILKNAGKLAADGSLQAPVALDGDTGISNGTASTWDSLVGQNRIIPLYSTAIGPGDNIVYQIVGFAAVRIVASDLRGNPKRVWVQPTTLSSNKVTAAPGGLGALNGVTMPPRLVIP